MSAGAVVMSAIHPEAERLAKLAEYDYAAQVRESARQLDVPVATLERLVSQYRRPDAVVDAVELGRRLSKLVFLLGADEPDAVVVAARALGNALKAGGRDWSYLASLVAQAEPSDEVTSNDESWIRAGEAILRASGLDAREREFVTDMLARFSCGYVATERQTKWFVALHRRFVRK